MEKETLDSFLAIQGVTGIALLGHRSRPYFFRSFEDLTKPQQEALSQTLFQVLNEMPTEFDFFDFQFASQRVFVYSLNTEWALLVAVNELLDQPAYSRAVAQIRQALSENTNKGLATFRLFARQIDTQNPAQGSAVPTDRALEALNGLCTLTTTYLGRAVIVNYWKTSRQEVIDKQTDSQSFLECFDVQRTAHIVYTGSLVSFNPAQLAMLQAWVNAFIRRCEEVIHNFRHLIKTPELKQADWQLLTETERG